MELGCIWSDGFGQGVVEEVGRDDEGADSVICTGSEDTGSIWSPGGLLEEVFAVGKERACH